MILLAFRQKLQAKDLNVGQQKALVGKDGKTAADGDTPCKGIGGFRMLQIPYI